MILLALIQIALTIIQIVLSSGNGLNALPDSIIYSRWKESILWKRGREIIITLLKKKMPRTTQRSTATHTRLNALKDSG